MTEHQNEQTIDEQEPIQGEAILETTPESDVQSELEAAQRKASEYYDQLLRAQADFQNFRKRQERERQDLLRSASSRLLERLLPVLDDLQRAAQHVPEELRNNDWVKGVLMVEKKLWGIMEAEGLKPIEATPGMQFDPAQHDALLSADSDTHPSNSIVQELERGYTLNDRVVRAAKVQVAR